MDNKINLILGTMTFGSRINENESKRILEVFKDNGYNEIDSAHSYNDGRTENILGNIISDNNKDSFKISTKINPRITGKLDGEAVKMQLLKSLNRLNRDYIDILYFHFPDPNIPVENALKMANELYEKGKFKELGLSNFPGWQVVDIWHICEKNGWVKPSIYQGMYNGLTRKAEKELFPALRKLDISFYAFNPLAGGILTGKYDDFDNLPSKGRFTDRPNYKNRYWKKSFFDALKILSDKCSNYDINLIEAAYRWLAFHSNLDSGNDDGIIIGVSNQKQLKQNINSIKNGELPDEIVEEFNEVWRTVEADSPDYFRYNIK